jgi:hypothetical protein
MLHAGVFQAGKVDKKRVVVDVREFMSSLPAVLHQQGMEVVPVTLEARARLIRLLPVHAVAASPSRDAPAFCSACSTASP